MVRSYEWGSADAHKGFIPMEKLFHRDEEKSQTY